MSDLGMPKAFTPEAEFPEFCNKSVYIDLMKQAAKIKVNEEGTEAAAVTIIGMKETSAGGYEMKHVKFHANRPFLYIISEQSTGAIFFIGQYMGNQDSKGSGTSIHTEIKSQTMGDDNIYNLSGQRLSSPPAHGIYFQNGKKFFTH